MLAESIAVASTPALVRPTAACDGAPAATVADEDGKPMAQPSAAGSAAVGTVPISSVPFSAVPAVSASDAVGAANADDVFDESDFGAFLSGYEGFGSFFSADVEVLIRQPEESFASMIPAFPPFARLDAALAATAVRPTQQKACEGSDSDDDCTPDDGAQQQKPLPSCVAAATPCATECDNAACAPSVLVESSHGGPAMALPPLPAFGRPFRDAFFNISDDFTFINHGAFGGSLRIGTHLKHSFEALMESQLLTYMDRLVLPWITHATRAVAKTVLKCQPTDLVLVPNATYGLNAAIAALITHGDVVVFLETEYLAVFKMLQERCEALLAASVRSGGALAPAALKELPLDGLLLDDAVMGSDEALARHIAEHMPKETTVLVIDLITSTASLHFPVFTHIIPLLKKTLPSLRHIIVDGAHGPLQCEVDFTAMAPEQLPSVYVGNLHKWFSAPKSAGIMWVREDVQEELRPIVVSHGAKNGFLSDFVWDGTRDHGALLALPAVVDFWYSYVGVDRVRAYCAGLKAKATAMLAAAWGTPSATGLPRGAPFMSLVELPQFFQRHSRFVTAKYIQDALHHRHRIEVPAKIIRGRLYLRVSFFVNNDMRDYERLRDAILAIQADILKDLRGAKAARLAAVRRCDSTCDNADPAKVGEKRSRSPAHPPAADATVEKAAAEGASAGLQRLTAAATVAGVQHHYQHHDKSQIVRDRGDHTDAAESSAASSSSAESTAAAAPQASLSAAASFGPFKPAALDVPLSIGGLKQIIVHSPAPSSSTNNNNNTHNNGGAFADSAAQSINTPTGAAGDMVTAGGMVLTAAPTAAPPAGGIDPNCNGCGIGAIGAAPKKTRRF